MREEQASIRILKLEVKADNRIVWTISKAEEDRPDYWHPLDHGDEKLDLDFLRRSTITFLIKELQLYSDWTHDKSLQMNTLLLIQILGEHLYRALFTGKIQKQLSDVLSDAELDLIRIELEFADGTLAQWPWEYLYKPDDSRSDVGQFLVNETQLLLNRRLSGAKLPPQVKTPKPVKVLFVVSRPREMDAVQYNSILDKIEELEKAKVISSRQLITQTGAFGDQYEAKVERQAFREIVNSFQPNIIHFIGHGQHTKDGGEIAFVKGNGGEPDWVKDQEFAEWCGSDKLLKLVFLQACESALPDPYRTISGMAMHLARRNIPAVVAMQYRIENEIAATFALGFYEELVKGKSVDLAVKAGRNAMQHKLSNDPLSSYAFGLPVLYLSSFESIIVEEMMPDVQPNRSGLIVGPQPLANPNEIECPGCHKRVQVGRKFCYECNLPLRCIFCAAVFKNENEILGKFCPECGVSLKCARCEQGQVREKITETTGLCIQCIKLRDKKQSPDASGMSMMNRQE